MDYCPCPTAAYTGAMTPNEDGDNAKIGERVRRARMAKGVKAVDLARAIGIEKQPSVQMNRFETGKRGISKPRLAKIAAELGVTVDSLLTDPPTGGDAAHVSLPKAARRVERDDGVVLSEALTALKQIDATPQERERLFDLVEREGARYGGWTTAALVQRILGWRDGNAEVPRSPTPADDALTAAATARGAAKGHAQLGKPKNRGR